jgi:hypothetical protein
MRIDQPYELAKWWFQIALWVVALFAALAALGLAINEEHFFDALGNFVGILILNEAFSVLPILFFSFWLCLRGWTHSATSTWVYNWLRPSDWRRR